LCLVLAGTGWLVSSVPAAAAIHTYRTGIDSGNDPGTGCDFSLGAVAPGTLPGFELQLTVEVDDDPVPPQVASAVLESCVAGSFGDPQALPGFELELDSGLLGSDSVVGAIPLNLLGHSPTVRLAHHALAASGAEDALFTTDGTPDGPPIVVEGVVPAIPGWSPLGAGLTTLLVAGAAWWLLRQRLPPSALVAILVVLLGMGTVAVVFAAWGDPAATDATADAAPADTRAEIFASFAMPNGGLALRLDVEDIPFETVCSNLTDDDADGLIDCEDRNCVQQVCSDGSGCTSGDTCQPLGGDGPLACLGAPVNCETIVGNECSMDDCQSLGPDDFVCNSSLDLAKLDFGSCTPDANCSARAPDGSCIAIVDLCLVGRCTEQAGMPPQFLCEGEQKTALPLEQGGCDDGEVCTLDSCDAGACTNAPICP
jgi:hypothetical protein